MRVVDGVVVANPGHFPQLAMAAEGLARAGMLASYVDPFAYAALPPSAAWIPPPLRRRLIGELSKRFVSSEVASRAVRGGAVLEALAVLELRTGLSGRVRLPFDFAQLRAVALDRRLARLLRPGLSALVVPYGAALESLRCGRELNLTTYLDFPIAHYRFAEQLLMEEAALEPAFAETLQFHRFSRRLESRWDEEIGEADRVLVPSTFARDTFIKFGVAGRKVISLPLGVDTELFHPVDHTPQHGRFRVLFVGQITQRKGISYLFEGFRRAAIPRSELILAGRICGSDRAWRHLSGVRHLGPLPRDQLPALYRSADVFVMPSLLEGFCLTALEAMACGVPVILSDNTGTGEITDGRAGFRVPIRDPDAIAKRLVELHEEISAREAMGHAAYEQAQLFSWRRFGENIATVVGGRGSVSG